MELLISFMVKGRVVGTAITETPEVDLISFTGSTATGKAIMHNGADTLKKFLLN